MSIGRGNGEATEGQRWHRREAHGAAPAGSVRREFGSDVMVNAAHASDSPDNALRELRIIPRVLLKMP